MDTVEGNCATVELLVGEVTHYYSKTGVDAMKQEAPLYKNARIHIVGHTTDLEDSVGYHIGSKWAGVLRRSARDV